MSGQTFLNRSELSPRVGQWVVLYLYGGNLSVSPAMFATRDEAKAGIGTLTEKTTAIVVEVRAICTPLPVQHEWSERA